MQIKTSFTLLFLAFFSTALIGQADAEYTKTLQKMFEVSGSAESYKAVIPQMFDLFKLQHPEVEEKIWQELEAEFQEASFEELILLLVPVYVQYLSKEDLEGIIEFYESPVGKKFALHTPQIMQESMLVGQRWGIKIGEAFEKKMKERGF